MKDSSDPQIKSPLTFRKSKCLNEEFESKIVGKENELLFVIMEDQALWLSSIFKETPVTVDNYFSRLKSGVLLCRLANFIRQYADDKNGLSAYPEIRFKSEEMCTRDTTRFISRDNVHKFLQWCRKQGVPQDMLFESNDCVEDSREGRREIIICLLNITRFFYRICDMPVPEMVKLEREIDNYTEEEILSVQIKEEECSKGVKNHKIAAIEQDALKSDAVFCETTQLASRPKSTSPVPTSEVDKKAMEMMDEYDLTGKGVWIGEGRFKINGKIVFVRMVNTHMVVRVGGGWETLSAFLQKNFSKSTKNDDLEFVSYSVSETPRGKISVKDETFDMNKNVMEAVTNTANKRNATLNMSDDVLCPENEAIKKPIVSRLQTLPNKAVKHENSSVKTEKSTNLRTLTGQRTISLSPKTVDRCPVQSPSHLKKFPYQRALRENSVSNKTIDDSNKMPCVPPHRELNRQLTYNSVNLNFKCSSKLDNLRKEPELGRSSTQLDITYNPKKFDKSKSLISKKVDSSISSQNKSSNISSPKPMYLKPYDSVRANTTNTKNACSSPGSTKLQELRPLQKMNSLMPNKNSPNEGSLDKVKDFVEFNKTRTALRRIQK